MKKYLTAVTAVLMFLVALSNTARAEFHYRANIVSNGIIYYVQPYGGGALPIEPPKPSLLGYPSASVFLSYGFNTWSSVVPASDDDLKGDRTLMPYAPGSLVNDHGTVYVTSNNQRFGIPSLQTFSNLGYKWESVINGDASYMMSGGLVTAGAHLPGALINQNGTIYYITYLGKEGFPSMDVFNSWGFKLGQIVAANQDDINMQMNNFGPIVQPWSQGNLTPLIAPLPL